MVTKKWFFFHGNRAVVILKRFSADKKSFSRVVHYVGAGINAALYLLFIIIILIFQFSYKDPEITCGGRVAVDRSDTINKQKQIAIGKGEKNLTINV
jgi:hypothetical protein